MGIEDAESKEDIDEASFEWYGEWSVADGRVNGEGDSMFTKRLQYAEISFTQDRNERKSHSEASCKILRKASCSASCSSVVRPTGLAGALCACR